MAWYLDYIAECDAKNRSGHSLTDAEVKRLQRALEEEGTSGVRRAWTAEEDQIIQDARARGLYHVQCADLVPGRTEAAVRIRLSELRDRVRRASIEQASSR